jgi:exodeoxyribonuclease V gamma subunit
MKAAVDSAPELAGLRERLGAASEPITALSKVAGHFLNYFRYRPAMLLAWEAGDDIDADGHALGEQSWQAQLWRAVESGGLFSSENAANAHPGCDTANATEQGAADLLKAAESAKLPAAFSIFCPNAWSQRDNDLITSLATTHQIDIYQIFATPGQLLPSDLEASSTQRVDSLGSGGRQSGSLLTDDNATSARPERGAARDTGKATPNLFTSGSKRGGFRAGNPLNQVLARQANELSAALGALAAPIRLVDEPLPDTLLGWLKAELRADAPPSGRILDPADRSISIQLSHGLDRQVEVLRDAIAATLAADPTLEPRDIAILTPDPERVAPLITANFSLGERGLRTHPAHGFRVQLAGRSSWQTNPLAALLLRLLKLPDTRIGASEVLDLCAEPTIARRFGFGPDELTRLSELVQRAEIRWGLNAAHRSQFGLDIAQNTWIFGIQRLALSVALSDHDLDYVGKVVPIDDVDSSDVPLIGAISEFIRRLAALTEAIQTDADPQTWAERCRKALELTDADSNQSYQLFTALASLVSDADGFTGLSLSRKAVIRLIEADFDRRSTRPAFGNGSAIVAGLSALRWVPHRVICLLGWDAARYPRRVRPSGDDLLADSPEIGDPDSVLTDRQVLADAIGAATDSLIVVCQGRSEVTNLPVALSGPIAELIATLDDTAQTDRKIPAGQAVTQQHPLQPFSPKAYSGTGLISFDRASFNGASAAQHARSAKAVNRFAGDLPELPRSEPVNLDDLVNFFIHPVRYLFRRQAGFTLSERPAFTDDIPIQPDALQTWALGRRYLDLRLSGHSTGQINAVLWRSGAIPPAKLGDTLLKKINDDARLVLDRIPALDDPLAHDFSVEVDGSTLFGQVLTRGDTLLTTEFSKLQPKHRLAAWVRLLALSAGVAGDWQAMTVTKSGVGLFAAPGQEQARLLLTELVTIYRYGASHPIPAPPRINEYWSMLCRMGQDPTQPRHSYTLQKRWEWETDPHWETFFSYPGLLDLPVPDDFPLRSPDQGSFQALLASLIWDPLNEYEAA